MRSGARAFLWSSYTRCAKARPNPCWRSSRPGWWTDVVIKQLKDDSADDTLREAGATLYNWAEFETGKIESLRIRARVTEPYVLRGSFQILADATPEPRVYWHPRFLERLRKVLGVAA